MVAKRLPHADLLLRQQLWQPGDLPRSEQHDDGGAQIDAADLVAALEAAGLVAVVEPAADAAAAGRRDLAGPDGLDAGDIDGADHDHGHGSVGGVEDGDHALVASEQAVDGAYREGGDRSEEHTSELQSRENLVCRLLLEKKKIT